MSLTQSERPRPGGAETNPGEKEAPTELLSLLNAEYTQTILETVWAESKSARTIAEACGASRPTVYRRLNALKDAGFISSELVLDPDGHHRTVFKTTLEAVSVDVTSEGLSVTVRTSDPNQSSMRSTSRLSD
jgi:DNA-binding MurR/RpiR family transcriptional regulator